MAVENDYQLARQNPPPLVLIDEELINEAMMEPVHG